VHRKASASLLATLALVAISAAPVAAAKPSSDYQNPVVDWVQPTVVARADGSATVHVQYTCYGGNEGTHVYIGVKQGPEVNATDHTSSQYAQTFYSTNRNAWNVTVKRLHVTGTQQAIIMWDPTLRTFRFDGADITNALSHAVRHEAKGASGIVYANITSTGSGVRGFYSSMGSKPSGVTFSNNSFR
jgi:hypothetical protein